MIQPLLQDLLFRDNLAEQLVAVADDTVNRDTVSCVRIGAVDFPQEYDIVVYIHFLPRGGYWCSNLLISCTNLWYLRVKCSDGQHRSTR